MMDAARSGGAQGCRLEIRASRPAANLIDVPEEIGRIVVDPTGASPLKLVAAVTAGQKAYAELAGALRSQHGPDTVADDQGGLDPRTQLRGSGQEEIRIGLAVFHLVPRHDRDLVDVDVKLLEDAPPGLAAPA